MIALEQKAQLVCEYQVKMLRVKETAPQVRRQEVQVLVEVAVAAAVGQCAEVMKMQPVLTMAAHVRCQPTS